MKDFRDVITEKVLSDAVMAMSEKQITDLAKKLAPKVLEEQLENALQDFIQEEIDLYEIMKKAGLAKKLSNALVESLKGM